MRRPPKRALSALVCTILATSCLGPDAPTGVGVGGVSSLAMSPALIPSPADASALPVNRIRTLVARTSDRSVLAQSTVDVDPGSPSWTLSIDVRLPVSPVAVDVTVQLLNVSGSGAESVQFSGFMGAITLSEEQPIAQPDIPIVRGPVANVFATGVTITSAPDTLAVGATAALSASATTSSTTTPTVFWTVLDSAVLSVSGSTLTGVAPGTGRVVASAGAFADTASVVVRTAPTGTPRVDVRIQKSVNQSQPLAGTPIRFTVSATNLGPVPATNLAVFDTLRRAAFTSPSHNVSTGTLVGDSLWQIPSLASGATATWTTDVTVATGVGGTSASNTARLRAVTPADSVAANDTARVTLNFPLSAVPTVTITAPADSSVYDPGDLVTFTGTASDPEDGNLTSAIVWRSNLDGQLGTGATVSSSSLRAGVHTISATATDSHSGIGADTIRVTIALYTMPTTLNVPFGGTASLPITLAQAAPTGGITLNVSSNAPTIANPTAATVFIPAGALSANVTLSGLLPGTANITVGNAQFGSAVVIATVRAELDILGGNVSFASPFSSSITVQLESQGTATAAPTGGLPVTLTAIDPGCVAVTSPLTILAGQVSRSTTLTWGGTTAPTCSSYVRATAANIVSDSVLVTVTPTPGINAGGGTVGAGLQFSSGAGLLASNHGGVTVTVTSSDPTRVVVSPDATTPGTGSITVNLANGQTSVPYHVQGVEGSTGGASVIVSAPNFNPDTAAVTVAQPGIVLGDLVGSTTTFSPDDHFYAYVGVPSGSSVSVQNVRAGSAGIPVTFAIDNLGIGVLKTLAIQDDTVTATIPAGVYYTPSTVAAGGVAFDPVGVGTATVTVRSTGLVTQPFATQNVTVSPPTISVGGGTVGAGLQFSSGAGLGAANHGGVTVTVTSSDPATMRVAPNATTPGTGSITVNLTNGQTSVPYHVQGVEGATGSATITVTAPGFLDGTTTVSVVQPGVVIGDLPASFGASAANDVFYAYVGVPSGNSVSLQNVRPGPGVTVTVSSTNPGVAEIVTSGGAGASRTAVVQPGVYYTPSTLATGGLELNPIAAGQTTISITAPGFIAQPLATQVVTITP